MQVSSSRIGATSKLGIEEGSRLACWGEVVKRTSPGHYFTPAILNEAAAAIRTSREEIFRPVASVIRARDYEEALAMANDTPFGVCAGICTTSLTLATHFKLHAQAGMVMLNVPTAGVDYHVSFGGRKGSGFGPRERGATCGFR